jgi:hypothetical protein
VAMFAGDGLVEGVVVLMVVIGLSGEEEGG